MDESVAKTCKIDIHSSKISCTCVLYLVSRACFFVYKFRLTRFKNFLDIKPASSMKFPSAFFHFVPGFLFLFVCLTRIYDTFRTYKSFQYLVIFLACSFMSALLTSACLPWLHSDLAFCR